MNNKFTHRFTALLLGGLCLMLGINAQEKVFQLPNSDFEQWEKGVKLNGSVTSSDQPVGWNSFGTATGSYAAFTKHSITKGEENGNKYAIITSSKVLGVIANGNMTTGIVNAGGTSATSTSNHNYTVVVEATGKNIGADRFRQRFAGRPDAMKVRLKYVPNGEGDIFKAQISAWIHTNEKFQIPYESNVKGKAVASSIISPSATDWQEFIEPFDYSVGNAGNEPYYILINAGTNQTPGKGAEGDMFCIDDLYFVYYSTLKDLKVSGVSVDGFNESVTEYNMDGEAPELASITADAKSPWATVGEVSQEEANGKITFSVTVKGNDYEVSGNQTTYKLIYTKAVEVVDVAPIVGTYVGEISIDMNAEGETDEENIIKEAASVKFSI